MLLSLIIPVFNEQDNLEELYGRSAKTLTTTGVSFEIVFVDDGSKDDTLNKLVLLHKKDNRCKILSLSRNFGHQAAYTAGMSYCKGDYICLMDGDLQDPPELIPEMFSKLKNDQLDVVFGRRIERNEGYVKKKMIGLFHSVFSRISNIGVPANTGNFSVMNRKALAAMLSFTECNRYLPGLRFFIGFEQGFVDYNRSDRTKGKAMKTRQLIRLALDAIFSFSNWPLKFCLYTGLVGTIIFFVVGVFSLVAKIIGVATPGWSSTLISIYFLGTVQLLFLGVIGEYVYRIYVETQKRAIYFIRKTYE